MVTLVLYLFVFLRFSLKTGRPHRDSITGCYVFSYTQHKRFMSVLHVWKLTLCLWTGSDRTAHIIRLCRR